jgi:hypothetical protein
MKNTREKPFIFLDSVAEESEYILETEARINEHIAYMKPFLLDVISVEKKQKIADYGINKLRDNGNDKLATYFFMLSNLKAFSKKTRDFFTDVMVYCEDQLGEYNNLTQVKKQYKKIRPTM